MWVIFVFVLIGAKCLERRGAVQLHFEICCWWLPTMCEWQYYWVGVANECLANLADWNDFFKKWRSKRLLMATRPTFNAADKHLFYLWERKAVRQFDVCETVRWWREKKKKPFISGGTRVRWTSICQSVSVVCQRSRFLLLSAAGPSVCTPKIDHYTARIGRR